MHWRTEMARRWHRRVKAVLQGIVLVVLFLLLVVGLPILIILWVNHPESEAEKNARIRQNNQETHTVPAAPGWVPH
jgi:hypothetical protein